MTSSRTRSYAGYLRLVGAMAKDLHPDPQSPRRGLIARWLRVLKDPHAYASVVFLASRLVTGLVSGILIITGLSLSFHLSTILVGVPLFLLFIAVRTLARLEFRLVAAVSGRVVKPTEAFPPQHRPVWIRVLSPLWDCRTWTTLLYQAGMLPVGILCFTVVVVGLSTILSLMAAPLVAAVQELGLSPDGTCSLPWWTRSGSPGFDHQSVCSCVAWLVGSCSPPCFPVLASLRPVMPSLPPPCSQGQRNGAGIAAFFQPDRPEPSRSALTANLLAAIPQPPPANSHG